MKTTLQRILTHLFLGAISFTGTIAQSLTSKYGIDSVECVKNQSLYAGYYEQKNFDMAVTFWRQNFNECPASSPNIYVRGQSMYTAFYERTKDKAYIDTILMILDQRSEYFGNKTDNDFRKAYIMHQYSEKHPELLMESYKILEGYINTQPDVVDHQVLATQMINAVKLYSVKQLTQEGVINNYSKITEILDNKLAATPNGNGIQLAKDLADNLLKQSGVATCSNLVPLFTPQINANPSDVALLKKVIGLLTNANCLESDLYYTSVENLYKLEKSAAAAYNLATMSTAKKDWASAEKYYLEAIELETVPMNKSNYLTMLATLELSNGDNQKARDYAKRAIEQNPDNGTAHFLVGSAYAGTKLGDDEFENKTVFWIAVDYYVKARNLDPQLTDRANESIEACSANFPKKDEAFFVGIYDEGVPYTVKGWINERTTVRFKK
ncbi:MAG: tetratricopeptide repeat protein [Bacteroidales bacterium]|nr:tetratricopeptide repeat protein [Bacteroidales bacterium]